MLSDNMKGAAWILASCVGATVMSVAVRALSLDLDSRMIAFLRCLFGLWLLAPFFILARNAKGRALLWPSHPRLHIARGVLMGFALNLGFYALAKLSLSTATILFFLAPVFVTIMAGPMLGEQVGPRRWAAVGVGFFGAMLILRPGFGEFHIAMLGAVASSGFFAASLLIAKKLRATDSAESLYISATIISALVTLPVALPVWGWPSGAMMWGLVALMAVGSSLRHYADIRGYQIGEAGFVAPFVYLRLIFIAAAAYFYFGEVMSGVEALGAGIICFSALYIARREHQRRATRPGSAAAP